MALPRIDPTKTLAWRRLKEHYSTMKKCRMEDLFRRQPDRFDAFSLRFEDMLVDYSKNILTRKTLRLLIDLAEACRLKEAIEQMFSGEKINETENRAVLHVALRNRSAQPFFTDGVDVMPEVNAVLKQMERVSNRVSSGQWRGYTGKPIQDIVHIGIGGSDLGPQMVTEALKPYWNPRLRPHFVSNVDGAQIGETLKKVAPETTLFLVASKTFTTQETMTNAMTAKRWFLDRARNVSFLKNHFIAISSNEEEMNRFGIPPENRFKFWDWVGGRYSVWSSVGLSIACMIGFQGFTDFLEGAHAMDLHFRGSPFEANLPVLLALIGIWYINFFGAHTLAILPYAQNLHRLPAYLEQLDMESNGKSVNRKGRLIRYSTGPIVWGEPGTNGQHAFFQLLHQGTKLIPCDFIAAANSPYPFEDHHEILLSHFFAQTEALMKGRTEREILRTCKEMGLSPEAIRRVTPHRVTRGNQPTNTILLKKITPRSLGSLIAMYEHKIFVQGILWNIYSFDQWGVELGKQLAQKILIELRHPGEISSHDPSTNGLINAYKKMKREETPSDGRET
ncbi:MAG: glucose-6-phosphate isomerase [Desulfobacterota bacterium]|nr:glucose-6-phosphate isomerase [Thermodesulfobacteriota bacterium]